VEITGAPSACIPTTVKKDVKLSCVVSSSDMSNNDDACVSDVTSNGGSCSSSDGENIEDSVDNDLFPLPCSSPLHMNQLDDSPDFLPISIMEGGNDSMDDLPQEAEFSAFLEEAAKWFD